MKGDVHDIGKNIVGVVLGCNNFKAEGMRRKFLSLWRRSGSRHGCDGALRKHSGQSR